MCGFVFAFWMYLKGFAMPPPPILGFGASFQAPGPLPMASARRAIGISLIESFWRAVGIEIYHFCMISVISGPRMLKELMDEAPAPLIWLLGITRMLKISFEFGPTRLTAEWVGGLRKFNLAQHFSLNSLSVGSVYCF